MSIRALTKIGCLFGLMLWVTGPGSTASPAESTTVDDDGGLVVHVRSWSVAPRNADINYAFVDESGQLAGGGLVQRLDYDRERVQVIYAGWRLPTSPTTELGMRFWEYDEDAAAFVGDLAEGSVGSLLSSPEFKVIDVDSAGIQSRLQATLVDGGANWTHQVGETGALSFGAGLRLFRFEQAMQVAYRKHQETFFGEESTEEFINAKSKADGLGPYLSIGYRQRFGRRFEVGAGFGLAVPVGDLEFRTMDEFFSVRDTFAGRVEEFKATVADEPATRTAFLQFDLDIELGVRFGDGWRATLGYAVAYWSDMPAGLRFIDDVSENTAVPSQTEAVFEGAHIGIGYQF